MKINFIEKHSQRSNKQRKSSVQLTIREMHIKTTIREHYMHIKMAKFLKTVTTPKAAADAEKSDCHILLMKI